MKRFIFDKVNTALFIAGTIMLVIGYFVMSLGDITVSPIILSIAHLVVFPAAITYGMIKKQPDVDKHTESDTPAKRPGSNRKKGK